jgi:hypothetical protein
MVRGPKSGIHFWKSRRKVLVQICANRLRIADNEYFPDDAVRFIPGSVWPEPAAAGWVEPLRNPSLAREFSDTILIRYG